MHAVSKIKKIKGCRLHVKSDLLSLLTFPYYITNTGITFSQFQLFEAPTYCGNHLAKYIFMLSQSPTLYILWINKHISREPQNCSLFIWWEACWPSTMIGRLWVWVLLRSVCCILGQDALFPHTVVWCDYLLIFLTKMSCFTLQELET